MKKTLVKDAVRKHRPWDVIRFVAHLPNFVRLFLGLLGDRRVSFVAKAILVGAAVYVVSPLDLMPDMVPFVGEMDDLALFTMACRTFIQMCPRNVIADHVARIDHTGEWAPFGLDAER